MSDEEKNPEEGQPEAAAGAPPEGTEDAAGAAAETPAPRKPNRGKAANPPPTPATAAPKDQLPSVGRVVHFMIPRAMHQGDEPVHRPAIVSAVRNARKGIVDLHVFVTRDDYPGNYHPGPLMVAEKVGYSESEDDGTWHWPERA